MGLAMRLNLPFPLTQLTACLSPLPGQVKRKGQAALRHLPPEPGPESYARSCLS